MSLDLLPKAEGEEVRKPSRAGLIRKIDAAFSRFIRKRAADEYGFCTCVTCGDRHHMSEIHAGHFVRRRHMAVRWDPENVHTQCVYCNTFLDGNEAEYSRFIIDTYGRETFDRLLASKRDVRKWSMPELRCLLEQYKESA
jgi:hypothetical protein